MKANSKDLLLVIERQAKEIVKLKRLITTDELTGVLNRRGLDRRLESLFKQALFSRNNPNSVRKSFLSIIFIDIDDFKPVNDEFGHEAGDIVLKEVASLIQKSVRNTDCVGRYGGEEFVVAIPGARESCCHLVAEKIRKAVEKEIFLVGGVGLKITLSLGVASVTKTESNCVSELVQSADNAMYEAKKTMGKNIVVKNSEIE